MSMETSAELRPGKPKLERFHYVYMLRSLRTPDRFYTGITESLNSRIQAHNSGSVESTASHRPWQLITFVGFSDFERAVSFERYLKSHSGRAFAKKRF
jgi:predicted GIY-YIG superfamily endonuclease